jgi:hypothetical protein
MVISEAFQLAVDQKVPTAGQWVPQVEHYWVALLALALVGLRALAWVPSSMRCETMETALLRVLALCWALVLVALVGQRWVA